MTDAEAHRNSVEAWREQRYAALRREIGWLTLAGLGWLKPGLNRIGSDPANDVVLPYGPSEAGTVTVRDGEVVGDGVFTHEGRPAQRLRLVSDEQGKPTMLELGPLRLCVIDRGGRLAIRTWNTDAPVRHDFNGIDHWPVDLSWRLDARFEPTAGRRIRVPDVGGTVDEEPSPGTVAFAVEGVTHRLQALSGGEAGELWLVFGDLTNGEESYGGGRFLYTAPPDSGGSVIVDFNRAYNPPCVFTPYATCPLPWPKNRLSVRIEAGEKAWPDAGVSPLT